MNMIDPQHWQRDRLRVFWHGRTGAVIRFVLTSLLLCASALAGSASYGIDSQEKTDRPSLLQAVSACRQLRASALAALDTQNSTKREDSADSGQNAAGTGSANWTIDSRGSRWIFDPANDIWRRAR